MKAITKLPTIVFATRFFFMILLLLKKATLS
nr:MAG TPA: hypothetical protein [Caudoviricetes sp.]